MAYELQGKTDSMALAGLTASMLYGDIGQTSMAARSLYWTLAYYVNKGDLETAQKYFGIYEQQSGHFDENHEIESDKWHYYSVKGQYFLVKGQIDSAEICFRKCLKTPKLMEEEVKRTYFINLHAASKGLTSLYQTTGQLDSLSKYSQLSEQYNDSIYKYSYMSEAMQMESMYNYSMHVMRERNLEKTILHNQSKMTRFIIFSIALLVITVFLLWQGWKSKIHYKRNLQQLKHEKEILDLLQDINDTMIDYGIVRNNEDKTNDTDIDSFSQQLKEAISNQEKAMNGLPIKVIATGAGLDERIAKSDIYSQFVNATFNPDVQLTNEDWDAMEELLCQTYPIFKTMIASKLSGSITDFRICMLMKIGISPSSIARFTNTSIQNISMSRKRIYKKITGIDGKAKDLDVLIKSIK